MEDRNEKSVQQNMLFNTVGSLIYYVCQWLMTVVIVRISGYEDSGLLSIAMSITAAPAIVGLFNIRSYQVSDMNGQYSDKTYIRSRMYTNLLSYLVCAAMILVNGYSLYKASVILVFMLFKVTEGFADVYYGIEQKWNRMDYAGISLTVRGIGTIAIFVGVFLMTKSLLLSILLMCIFSMAVVLFYDRRIVHARNQMKEQKGLDSEGRKEVWNLLLTCLPLAVVAFLNNLSINIPKIYLEKFFGSEVMGYYSSVASPTVVIQLAATTIFAPLVPVLTLEYNNGQKTKFMEIIRKFAILVLGLSVVALLGSKLLGRWALVLLFGKSIEPFVYLFVPIIVISILIAVNASLFSVCTLLRTIRPQYLIGVAGVVSAWLFSLTIVKSQSMIGVVWALAGSLLIQIVIQLFLIIRKVRKM